jgi:hypothetical protein
MNKHDLVSVYWMLELVVAQLDEIHIAINNELCSNISKSDKSQLSNLKSHSTMAVSCEISVTNVSGTMSPDLQVEHLSRLRSVVVSLGKVAAVINDAIRRKDDV